MPPKRRGRACGARRLIGDVVLVCRPESNPGTGCAFWPASLKELKSPVYGALLESSQSLISLQGVLCQSNRTQKGQSVVRTLHLLTPHCAKLCTNARKTHQYNHAENQRSSDINADVFTATCRGKNDISQTGLRSFRTQSQVV